MKSLLRLFVRLVLVFGAVHTLLRLFRHLVKFPVPEGMANLIDNPWRRSYQPPEQMPVRHALKPGMTVLEVGPGNGRYSVAAARYLGEKGRLVAVDIEPKMIERVRRRMQEEGITNISTRVASVHALPFEDASFDAVYMITVIGEIPQPQRAVCEFARVLRPGGVLAFSEFFPDPDYPLASTLTAWARQAGLNPKQYSGNFFAYSLVFEKPILTA